jgi:hypothetical protein
MASRRPAKNIAENFPSQIQDEPGTLRSAGVTFIAEDGWVFIERPGQGIKCVRRYNAPDIDAPAQPNRARHSHQNN